MLQKIKLFERNSQKCIIYCIVNKTWSLRLSQSIFYHASIEIANIEQVFPSIRIRTFILIQNKFVVTPIKTVGTFSNWPTKLNFQSYSLLYISLALPKQYLYGTSSSKKFSSLTTFRVHQVSTQWRCITYFNSITQCEFWTTYHL